jgi:hypothetical protein
MKIRWTAFVLAGFAHLAHAASHTDAKLIARAMSAAPAKVAKDARIVDMDASGHLRELRAGTNGWTCYPHDPGSPRGDAWCLDVNGQAWLDALMAHRAPDPDTIGFSYMLAGGSTWSNLDPDATKPEPGHAFVSVPPHVMILSAKAAAASGYPSGQLTPDTSKPFVMYGGTPYAIVILPVK